MWPNPQETADLVTYTEKIINAKLHFLCSVWKALNGDFVRLYVLSLLVTYTWKPKVPGSSPTAGYVQRWALCSNRPANV